ncbi:MAG: lysophospholipid acyltransferase family protein [Gemmatimonadaceae bacterium]|nr:lysophospholipid acyltransferase family protein [Gemmatimonadaceae bacterium]
MKEVNAQGGIEANTPPREPRSIPAPAPGAAAFDLRTRVLIRLTGWLLFALARTWRVRVHGRKALLARRAEDARVVVTLWHGQLLPVSWAQRQPTRAMISEHRDGEMIAHIVGLMGIGSIRGSSSRGGARALLECARVLRSGADVAITPDGPRGPRHSFAPGALIVAFRAQTVIVPIGAHVDRAWRLRSWDQFEIPKPFARVTMVYGTPLPVAGADVREVSARTGEFAAAMEAVTAEAARLARWGVAPP